MISSDYFFPIGTFVLVGIGFFFMVLEVAWEDKNRNKD